MEPRPPAMGSRSLNCCATREVPKLVNFCVAILTLKVEEKKQHFRHIMRFIISRKVKMQLKRKKRFVQWHGEGAVSD